MKKQATTQEHIIKLIEFRQAIHGHGFGKKRDALSEVLDAVCLIGGLSSFPMLSFSKAFRRRWHSLYKAVERGTLVEDRLSRYLALLAPQEGIQYFALDGST